MIHINEKYILKRNVQTTGYRNVLFVKGNLFWADKKHSSIKFVPDDKGEVEVLEGVYLLNSTLTKQYDVIITDL